jgi:hypothetical protein
MDRQATSKTLKLGLKIQYMSNVGQKGVYTTYSRLSINWELTIVAYLLVASFVK